jgi:hypothetical protein
MKRNIGWKPLVKESMDTDMELRDIIKKDPTEFALAVRSFILGLIDNCGERGLYEAISYISNKEIQEVLFQVKREEYDKWVNNED